MLNLRKAARGRPCCLRVPGVCKDSPEHSTVVLCHLRRPGDGMGIKPPDTRAVLGCHACHDWLDRRLHPDPIPEAERAGIVASALDETRDRLAP